MYNDLVTRLFQQPYHQEVPGTYTSCGQAGSPGEGPFMTVYLLVAADRVLSAYFQTYGCPSAVACGSFVCGWAEGKTQTEAKNLDANTLLNVLGGLPLGKEHAAQLAIRALRRAIEEAEEQNGATGAAGVPQETRGEKR